MTTGIYHGIRSRPSTPEYRATWDRIFGKNDEGKKEEAEKQALKETFDKRASING